MPMLENTRKQEESLWINPEKIDTEVHQTINEYSYIYLKAAQKRFMRFLPYIAEAFPETAAKKGVIESGLIEIPAMKEWLNTRGANLQGRVFLKDDAHLPVGGSVEVRGGVHAVLRIAEDLARDAELLVPGEKYNVFNKEAYRQLFGQYTILLCTGADLALAAGLTAEKLGFRVIAQLPSGEAEWKKQLLKEHGIVIREYEGDYRQAVSAAKREADADPKIFLIDKDSKDLFFGYSSAALRLKVQLGKMDISVDPEHPLFVYIPGDSAAAAGGLTYGLKEVFGRDAHCLIGESVSSSVSWKETLSGEHRMQDNPSEQKTGNSTADENFTEEMLRTLVSGIFQIDEESLNVYRKELVEKEQLFLEASACAGFAGPEQIQQKGTLWESYLEKEGLKDHVSDAVHIVWGTTGGLHEKVLKA
ncbi:MAG: D-serine ammonia-lyase [Lachnospiraceae bacterium]|nr:D-serine ammonia-lyase [Lachnospiraceae bacterium]